VIAGRPGYAGREQRDGAGAADREGGAGGPDLGEVLGASGRLHFRGFLIEAGEPTDVTGDDAIETKSPAISSVCMMVPPRPASA
jgi:hypothetical protein